MVEWRRCLIVDLLKDLIVENRATYLRVVTILQAQEERSVSKQVDKSPITASTYHYIKTPCYSSRRSVKFCVSESA
jgi:hypothetical protein